MEGSTRPIRDFMTPDPFAIDEALTLADAATRMREHDIRHLLVLNEQVLTGVVDGHDIDLALAVGGRNADTRPLSTAAREPYLCSVDTPVGEVAFGMQHGRHTCAVVVDGDLAVGIFTLSDALAMLAGQPPVHGETHASAPSLGDRDRAELARSRLRVRRILSTHHAAPDPNDGQAFGKVFNR